MFKMLQICKSFVVALDGNAAGPVSGLAGARTCSGPRGGKRNFAFQCFTKCWIMYVSNALNGKRNFALRCFTQCWIIETLYVSNASSGKTNFALRCFTQLNVLRSSSLFLCLLFLTDLLHMIQILCDWVLKSNININFQTCIFRKYELISTRGEWFV